MARYWVVGGTYASTSFRELAPGAEEIRLGPFINRAEAEAAWAQMAWRSVDECNTRFIILCEDGAGNTTSLDGPSGLEMPAFARP